MTALDTVVDVWCLEGNCEQAAPCPVCGIHICADHSDEFTTCAGDDQVLHHVDCALDCIECSAAAAEDDAEDRHEAYVRERC